VDAYYVRGLIYSEKLGDNRQAITDFSSALRLDDRQARAYFKRGNARTRLGDHDGAIDDYDSAIALDPSDADAYFNRGVVLYNLQNPAAALDDLIRSAELYADRNDGAGRDKAAAAIQQVMGEMGNQ
jgi:tetratricopeptide (TPR) repeat protein